MTETIIDIISERVAIKDKESVLTFFQQEYKDIQRLQAKAKFKSERLEWINRNYETDDLINTVQNYFLHDCFTTEDMLEHLDRRIAKDKS